MRYLFIKTALCATALAFAAAPVGADWRRGGGYHGGGYSRGYGGGYGRGYGGGWYGRGYGGYGLAGYGGYYGLAGYGGYATYGGYGLSSYPVYGSYSAYSSTDYPGYNSGYSPTYFPESAPATTEYQSFYPPEATAPAAAPSGTTTLIRVYTVPGAQLWFNGVATTQSGRVRSFVTPELRQGQTYAYEVTARWMNNGEPVDRTETVHLTAGRVIDLDLTPLGMK